MDLIEHRQITEPQHDRFIRDNDLKGGLFLSAKTGENVVRAFYKVSAEAVGVKLNSGELAIFDKVLKAHILESKADEGRTNFADDVEREDAEAEARKKEMESKSNNGCSCTIS